MTEHTSKPTRILITGPPGAGKTYLMNMLLEFNMNSQVAFCDTDTFWTNEKVSYYHSMNDIDEANSFFSGTMINGIARFELAKPHTKTFFYFGVFESNFTNYFSIFDKIHVLVPDEREHYRQYITRLLSNLNDMEIHYNEIDWASKTHLTRLRSNYLDLGFEVTKDCTLLFEKVKHLIKHD